VDVDGKTAREILRGCVCSRTRMLDRVLSRVFDDSLAPLGVRASQLTVLALIGAMEGLRATDVARYLEMDKSTVSRGLALLGARGWVEESAGPTRKAHHLDITAEGRAPRDSPALAVRRAEGSWGSRRGERRGAPERCRLVPPAPSEPLKVSQLQRNLNRRGAAP